MIFKALTIWPHYLLPQKGLTRLVGKLAASKVSWLKNAFIKLFIKLYRVDLSEAIIQDPTEFKNFNDFFTRELQTGARHFDLSPKTILSPADGTLSQVFTIENETLIQAKNRNYSLRALLANQDDLVKRYLGGDYALIYLAPHNYHRYHMPCDGRLTKMIYVPGDLFSVNQASSEVIDSLFARNERLICVFETDFGEMTIVLVGAMIVAGITVFWHGAVTPPHGKEMKIYDYLDKTIQLKKGEPFGYFCLGSTVITLFPPSTIQFYAAMQAGQPIQVGEAFAETV